MEELNDRINTCLDAFFIALAERLPEQARKRVVLFSHAATIIVLLRKLMGDSELNIRVGCCSNSELVRKKDSVVGDVVGAYEPVVLANGTHLQKGSDRMWGFDYVEVVIPHLSVPLTL